MAQVADGRLLFGVATADHQCESYDPRFEDIHDRWERRPGQTPRGRATDFWNRYPEDVAIAGGLGCHLFRFSIAWARVEPEPHRFEDATLRHYERVVDEIHDRGMEPVVTLLHSTWPPHIEEAGGLQGPDWPERFAGYTSQVVAALGPKVRYWITINEPTMLPLGVVKPWWQAEFSRPPGLPGSGPLEQAAAAADLIRNLFIANARAYDTVKAGNPDAQVSANPYIFGVPQWMQRVLDRRYRGLQDSHQLMERLGRIVHPPSALAPIARLGGAVPSILNGNWWHTGLAGKLAPDICPRECAGKQDFVALDYYWGLGGLGLSGLRRLAATLSGDYESAPVYPPLLGSLLRYHSGLFPGQPIWVVENGCVDSASGVSRALYLRQHLAQVRAVSKDGVPVGAYICWSVTTNREWGLPAVPGSDFGLYHVDLDSDPSLGRIETEAATTYRDLISRWPEVE